MERRLQIKDSKSPNKKPLRTQDCTTGCVGEGKGEREGYLETLKGHRQRKHFYLYIRETKTTLVIRKCPKWTDF